MPSKTLVTRIISRNDTKANWELQNPILLKGELGVEIDTNRLKVGDGVSSWLSREYIGFNLAGDYATKDDLRSIISEVKSYADGLAVNYAPASDSERISDIESEIVVLKGNGEGSVKAIAESAATAAVNAFATSLSDDGVVNTFKELVDYVASHGSGAPDMAADIVALKGLVANKVDKVEGKGLSTHDFNDALLSKLTGIEDNAQVNVIEGVKLGGTILDIIDKIVEIPNSSVDRHGVVKSSSGANKVTVLADGTMEAKTISVDSLAVPIGMELILDGGSSSTNKPTYPTRVGNIGYNSLNEAVNAAGAGGVVTLQDDVNLGNADNDHLVIDAEKVTLDLGGQRLLANGSNGAVNVTGGQVTLKGGSVEASLGSDNYSMALWASNGRVVIENGVFSNATDGSERGTDLIYASGAAQIEILGGEFKAAKPEWTLNCKDTDYRNGTCNIIVKGGRFYKFDPSNNLSEGVGTNYVADGFKSVRDGDYYVVTRA